MPCAHWQGINVSNQYLHIVCFWSTFGLLLWEKWKKCQSCHSLLLFKWLTTLDTGCTVNFGGMRGPGLLVPNSFWHLDAVREELQLCTVGIFVTFDKFRLHKYHMHRTTTNPDSKSIYCNGRPANTLHVSGRHTCCVRSSYCTFPPPRLSPLTFTLQYGFHVDSWHWAPDASVCSPSTLLLKIIQSKLFKHHIGLEI